MTQLLEFNIDVSFVNAQNIIKDFQGFVYEIEHCQYMIPIQIESFANLEFQKDDRDMKMIKDYDSLKELNLNSEETLSSNTL